MKIRRDIVNFPEKLKIYKAVEKGSSTIEYLDYVDTWEQLEHCIIQAKLDKENDYCVEVPVGKGHTLIWLTDKEIFDKVWKIYPAQTSFPLISYALQNDIDNGEELGVSYNRYVEYYGKFE